MKLILSKLKKFLKNGGIRILVVVLTIIVVLMIFLSFFSANKRLLKLIDKNKVVIDDFNDSIQKNNVKFTVEKIKNDINHKNSLEERERLLNSVNAVIEDSSLNDYQKNKELNRIHDSIKIFK